MEPFGTPRQQRQDDSTNRKNKSPRIKDRVYVQFADDFKDKPDDILKYTDESEAYSTVNTRGHFTPNPLVNGPADKQTQRQADRADAHIEDSGRTFDFFSPEKRRHGNEDKEDKRQQYDGYQESSQKWTSPRQSQGALADRLGQDRGLPEDRFSYMVGCNSIDFRWFKVTICSKLIPSIYMTFPYINKSKIYTNQNLDQSKI